MVFFAGAPLMIARAPYESTMGLVQKIFYFHVPAWIAMFSAVFVCGISSAIYLFKGKKLADHFAVAAAELTVLFGLIGLVTGPLWARKAWGLWWQWDARLTTSLILWFLYVAYFMVRGYATTSEQGARYAAAVGIIGFIDVPIVYLSVHWWRTVHPPTVLGPLSESASIAPSMALTLLVSFVAISVLSAYLILERYSLRQVEFKLEEVRRSYGES